MSELRTGIQYNRENPGGRSMRVGAALAGIALVCSGCSNDSPRYTQDEDITCLSILQTENGTPLFEKPEIPTTAENSVPDANVRMRIDLKGNPYLKGSKVYLTLHSPPETKTDNNGKWVSVSPVELMPAFTNSNDITATTKGNLWLLTGKKQDSKIEKDAKCAAYSHTYIK